MTHRRYHIDELTIGLQPIWRGMSRQSPRRYLWIEITIGLQPIWKSLNTHRLAVSQPLFQPNGNALGLYDITTTINRPERAA